MTQGLNWGVFKWLMEKPRVRKIADRATEALNDAEDKVKATRNDDLKRAYNHLATQAAAKGKKTSKDGATFDPEVLQTAREVFDADEETETTRLGAEETFAEGERELSVAMARVGAQKAPLSTTFTKKPFERRRPQPAANRSLGKVHCGRVPKTNRLARRSRMRRSTLFVLLVFSPFRSSRASLRIRSVGQYDAYFGFAYLTSPNMNLAERG